ncbi:uncharacterized protein [Macrobrachium rosenbergii]|uniref:uncharacterized protein n=1 Tax=Macrobrachium rosenbergii TaxID=79674 RepID=UPI0034D5E07A
MVSSTGKLVKRDSTSIEAIHPPGATILRASGNSADNYGNVKTHKPGNPLHPIISQIPSLVYQLAKRLSAILTPYILGSHSLKSSAEFLKALRKVPPGGCIALMNVESLFTNVPVNKTIQMILDRVYRDPTTPSLNILEHALHALQEICTKKAPFSDHSGHMYAQIDGVAVGSPLGVLFTNFCMGTVEQRVLKDIHQPRMYRHYIDDTFVSGKFTRGDQEPEVRFPQP